jgi:hypothetical protein
MALSNLVKEVIALSSAAHDYWERELPKSHPNYPLVNEGDDDPPPPEEEKKLEKLLHSLPADVIWQLALIAYLPWGKVRTDDLPGGVVALKRRFETPERAANRLLSISPLASYLSDGLEELKNSGIDVDELPDKIAA